MNRFLWVALVLLCSTSLVAGQEIDYSRLELSHTLAGHQASISAMAVSPDGKTLATASYDKTLRIRELPSGELKQSNEGHASTIRALCYSPDGTILASAAGDNAIKLWDVAEGVEIANFPSESESRTLTFSADSETLAAASYDKTIRIWSVRKRELKTKIQTGHRTWVREILFSPDGKMMASNGYYDVKIWNAAGKEIGTIEGRASAMMFSLDGTTLTSAISNKVRQWSVTGAQTTKEGESYVSFKNYNAILSPDGKTLASVDQNLAGVNLGQTLAPSGNSRCRLSLMDIESGKERTISETRDWFGLRSFSPNGAGLVLWNWNDESISIVDAASGKRHARLTSPNGRKYKPGGIPPLAFTPNGRTLITTHGPLICLWVAP